MNDKEKDAERLYQSWIKEINKIIEIMKSNLEECKFEFWKSCQKEHRLISHGNDLINLYALVREIIDDAIKIQDAASLLVGFNLARENFKV